ncbi:MAG: hypothetical protein MHM6MM_007951 [Cercozoa sp. M6MM]
MYSARTLALSLSFAVPMDWHKEHSMTVIEGKWDDGTPVHGWSWVTTLNVSFQAPPPTALDSNANRLHLVPSIGSDTCFDAESSVYANLAFEYYDTGDISITRTALNSEGWEQLDESFFLSDDASFVSPLPRLGLEVVAPGLRHDWLLAQAGFDTSVVVMRSFVQLPCRESQRPYCDDSRVRRFVADLPNHFPDGRLFSHVGNTTIGILLKGQSVPMRRSFGDWSGLAEEYRHRPARRDFAPSAPPFVISVVRNANEKFDGGCRNDVLGVCGRIEDSDVSFACLGVSHCPTATRPYRDWVLLAGKGLNLMRSKNALVTARLQDRHVRQGSASNDKWRLVNTFVDLQNEAEFEQFPADVADTLEDIGDSLASKFGHADVANLHIDDYDRSSIVGVLPVPRELTDYGLSVSNPTDSVPMEEA